MSHSKYQLARQAEIEEARTGAAPRLWQAMTHLWRGDRYRAGAKMLMAWERMTNSGDYAPDGHFDRILPAGWRDTDVYCDVFHSADSGHGPIRAPQAAPIAQDKTPDDRRHQQPELTTADDSGIPGDGKPRAMEIPPFLAGE